MKKSSTTAIALPPTILGAVGKAWDEVSVSPSTAALWLAACGAQMCAGTSWRRRVTGPCESVGRHNNRRPAGPVRETQALHRHWGGALRVQSARNPKPHGGRDNNLRDIEKITLTGTAEAVPSLS